ncbi:MAG: hypothetical protein EOM12_09550 [Verrucomicrobiae bacterium]|nr:hypothetical protein [Verrucomicrobiae bacterium]
MAAPKPRKIGSALAMQGQLEELFFQAVEAGNIKAAGYIGQIWVSCEAYAKEERAGKDRETTSIDKLCKILDKARKELQIKETEGQEE